MTYKYIALKALLIAFKGLKKSEGRSPEPRLVYRTQLDTG